MKRVLNLSLTLAMAASLSACDSGTSTPADVTMPSTANPAQYVADTLTVPDDRTTFGYNLIGDPNGKVFNQLGNIIGALDAQLMQGSKVQDGVNKALAAGSVLFLITETSADATYMTDSAAGTKVQLGNPVASPTPAPKFDGTDHFTVNTQTTEGDFAGTITNGLFNSNSPATTTHPVTVTLSIPLVSGAAPLNVSVVGAHIQYKYSGGKLMSGQINGAIKQSDVTGNVIPTVTNLLNSQIQANPTSSTNKQILMIFDTGGDADPACSAMTCKNPDGSCAAKGDGKIDICEVQTNQIIKNVLNQDVQMFDSTGAYHPNPANTTKDSLSLGIGFTAVKASF